jgi:hypothetical protein
MDPTGPTKSVKGIIIVGNKTDLLSMKTICPDQRIRQRIRSDSGLWTDIQIPSVEIRWDPSVGI